MDITPTYLVFGGLLAIAASGIIALRAPITGLLVWAAMFPIQIDTVRTIGFRFAPSDVVLVGLLIGTAVRVGRDRIHLSETIRALIGPCLLLTWLVALATIALLTAGHLDQYVVVNKLIGLTSLVLSFGLVALTAHTSINSSRPLEIYCIIGSAWNAIGVMAYLTWNHIEPLKSLIFAPGWENRVRGLLVDPNAYGGYVASIAVLQLCVLAKATRPSALLSAANASVLLVGLALTNSRSAWLALLCGTAALIMHLSPVERRRLRPYGFVLLLIGGALSLRSFGVGATHYEATMRGAALDYRFSLAVVAIDAFRSSPIWGVGLGLFEAAPGQRGYIPHSTYLWLMAETGLVGLVLFLAWSRSMYISASRVVAGTNRELHLPAIVVISVLCAWLGLMVGIEASYQRHYWFLLALGFGIATKPGTR